MDIDFIFHPLHSKAIDMYHLIGKEEEEEKEEERWVRKGNLYLFKYPKKQFSIISRQTQKNSLALNGVVVDLS